MRYIIMADGNSTRWNNYLGIPKHLIRIDGETLIERTVRLFREHDEACEIIVTSHNKDYEFSGAVRHQPVNNVLEIDRFTKELISDNMCFLYGDTYYSEHAIHTIVQTEVEDVLFFGNENSIVAIKIVNGKLFDEHVSHVRSLFISGVIENCIGWQVYQSILGLPFKGKEIADKYVVIRDETMDFNEPEDYLTRKERDLS